MTEEFGKFAKKQKKKQVCNFSTFFF